MEFLKLKPQHDEVIFVDEYGFSLSMRRKLGRSVRGKRANLSVRSIRSKNVTLIAAMSPRRLWTFNIVHGSVNTDVFDAFVKNLIRELGKEGKRLS